MALVYKINTAKIRKNEIMQDAKSGFITIPITFMRVGILLYRDFESGQIIREYVSPEELFKPESMNSANGAIFCEDHPPDMLNIKNWKTYILGSNHSTFARDNYFLDGKVTVYDEPTIESILSEDKDEISAGYWVHMDGVPGICDLPGEWFGQEFDLSQKDIIYNHIGRVWFGRAGEEVKMKKNFRKNNIDYPVYYQVPDENIFERKNESERKKIMIFKSAKLGNRDVKVNEADDVWLTQYDQEIETERKNAGETLTAEKQKSTSLQAELDITKQKLNELENKDHAAEFQAKQNLLNYVKPVLGDVDIKTPETQIKRNYLDKVYPSLKINEKDDKYIATSFEFHQQTEAKENADDQEKYNTADQTFRQAQEIAAEASRNNSSSSTDKILDKTFKNLGS